MSLPTMTAPPTAPTVSDDSQTFNDRAFALVAWFATHVAEQALWATALPSVITGTDFSGTSTTSVTVGTGAKSFTTQTGKQFQVGQPVRVAETADPSNYMDGQVTAYNSGTGALDVSVSDVGGSGTIAAWTISLLPGGSGSFVTLSGAQTLEDKTLTAPTIATITNGGTVTIPSGTLTLASRAGTETLTNKTLSLASNTISGTLAQFNTACSDADFCSLAGSETLTNKTLTAPTVNGGTLAGVTINASSVIASSTINASNTVDDTGTIAAASPGFRGLPQNAQTSAYALVLTDAGKSISITTGGITIPANGSVAFPIGTTIELFNNSGSAQNVAITTDTLRWAGTTNTGTRSLLAYGSAVIVKRTATMWTISGNVA